MRPRILLSVELKRENYIEAIECSGGIAVAEYCPAIDLSYDGLLLCGGRDVNPARYGEAVDGAVDIDYDRDAAEFALVKAYIEAGKPVFGICRGCQVLNVYFGGTLYQHLENTHLHRSETDVDRVHYVEAVKGSLPHRLYGDRYAVNSVHHEAVKNLGNDLVVSQASDDGIIEGFEHTSMPVFAVQWHPERLISSTGETVNGSKLFEYFVSLCK